MRFAWKWEDASLSERVMQPYAAAVFYTPFILPARFNEPK